MANAVYREFAQDDLSSATVHAWPSVIVESGSSGWTGNTNQNNNGLSLYGGARARSDVNSGSRSGLELYPLDDCDTHSIDKVIGVPGTYPMTASINLVYCTNEDIAALQAIDQFMYSSATDTRWYDEHWAPINLLCGWYHDHAYDFYPAFDALPATFSAVHVPAMFYGRSIATGTVHIWHNAWQQESGSNFGTGTRHYLDDGLGRLFDVPAAGVGDGWRSAFKSGTAVQVGNVFYNEGLIVFTNPSASWHREFLSQSYAESGQERVHIEFSGSTLIKSMVFMCRLASGDANASNNPTWMVQDTGSGKFWARNSGSSDHRTYITAVGLYNEERQLVAVAKIAQPIRKRETDNLDIRLRLDV